ncbi:hypothetical protein PDESU_00357 [Pontiella desulfatans]|uniref:DUF6896 domain-containing protein n=1 Tax=Pontiella desulfatans TaxID=2750659 RepID=A0A6C2TVX0_PONDE|nr:hypothetical protein [Pontiella desulfatans]VGO11810.1 hypothetical protein PDESU_00357 [Pontiella desulfatans]
MTDKELVQNLINLWYAERAWAEEVLKRSYKVDEPFEVLNLDLDDVQEIPGTNWHCRPHGVGVDIFRTDGTDGIDFDFDRPEPDSWRLMIFLRRQYEAGNLNKNQYRELYESDDHLELQVKGLGL